jgi:hypothetical protein
MFYYSWYVTIIAIIFFSLSKKSEINCSIAKLSNANNFYTNQNNTISRTVSNKSDNNSYFAICLAVKDELDLSEWVEYHKRKGCSKFYIFDNNSEKPLNNSIMSYINDGIVSYFYITGNYKPSNQIKISKL